MLVAGPGTEPGRRWRSRVGAGLGLPSHRGILMSSLARSDEGVGGGVTKTDDSRPALLIFLLGEGVTTRPGVAVEGGVSGAWVSSALVRWLSSCCWYPMLSPPLSPLLPPLPCHLSPPSSLLPALCSFGPGPFPLCRLSFLLPSPFLSFLIPAALPSHFSLSIFLPLSTPDHPDCDL